MTRVASATPILDELIRQRALSERGMALHLAHALYQTPTTERRLKVLTWRERLHALNHWRWSEFRSGLGYRLYVIADVNGLRKVVEDPVEPFA